MASNRNVFVRKAIGIGLSAIAAIVLAIPAAAQTGSSSSSQSGSGSGSAWGAGAGVGGGIPGGIQGGIPGGVWGGIPGGIQVDVLEKLTGGVTLGIPGGILGRLAGTIPGGLWGDMGGAAGFAGRHFIFDDRDQDKNNREDDLYNQGAEAMNEAKWDRAVDRFDLVAQIKGKRADAALYWKAWAQNRLGQRTEALTTITGMEKEYPQSRWLNDAKILEVEIRQKSGQNVAPETQTDCETKLMALNSLQQVEPARAVPILEKMLHSPDCYKLRSSAIFILAQSDSNEARELLGRLAQGTGANPVLQERAISALGQMGRTYGRDILAKVYASSNDMDTKKAILRALGQSSDRSWILNAAKTEKDPVLRTEAIRQLGYMGAREEIWQLYSTETSVDVKKQILQSMWQSGDMDRVAQIARNEKDHTLRLSAINDLGMMGKREGSKAEETLVAIYGSDTDPEVRKKVVSALFMSGDAHGLVALARKETDPEMKKSIVSHLANMRDKEATDYMMELLNK